MEMNYFPEVFDSSMIGSFKKCPQFFLKAHLQNWKPIGPSIHLGAGGAFAKGLEVTRTCFYVDNMSVEDSLALGVAALLRDYGDLECPEDSGKTWENMAGALVYYLDMYPMNHQVAYPIILPGNKRAIEFNYTSPLAINHPVTGHPILYTGRSDAIVHFADDNYICDEKTTGQLGKTWSRQWDLRSQFTGYCWLAREHGLRVAGVLVRGIAIYKTQFAVAEAITNRSDWAVDRWYVELLSWINDAIRMWKSGEFKYNLDDACTSYGGCQFLSVCQSQNEPAWLEPHFERRRWDPISRSEVKL
jgi:hypothetical protein